MSGWDSGFLSGVGLLSFPITSKLKRSHTYHSFCNHAIAGVQLMEWERQRRWRKLQCTSLYNPLSHSQSIILNKNNNPTNRICPYHSNNNITTTTTTKNYSTRITIPPPHNDQLCCTTLTLPSLL